MALQVKKKEGETPKKSDAPEEVFHLTKADLARIVAEAKKGETKESKSTLTEERIVELLENIKTDGEGVSTLASTQVEAVDPADFLDKPALFFCYSFSHACFGDIRFGQQVNTPYRNRPILFKPLYRYKKPGGAKYGAEMISMSVAKITSKKEAAWVRSHSLFGIRYFESANEVANVRQEFADKLVEISNMIGSMSEYEIVQRAKAELKSEQITTDIDAVKKLLVYQLADKAMIKSTGQVTAIDPNWEKSRTEEVLLKT